MVVLGITAASASMESVVCMHMLPSACHAREVEVSHARNRFAKSSSLLAQHSASSTGPPVAVLGRTVPSASTLLQVLEQTAASEKLNEHYSSHAMIREASPEAAPSAQHCSIEAASAALSVP